MRVAVTGNAGFIGSHLVDELLRRNYEVVGIDNLSTGIRENIDPRIKFYECDLATDKDSIIDILSEEKIKQVYHIAARARVQPSYLNPSEYIFNNVQSTQNLLQGCVLTGIKNVVYASSSTVSYLDTKNGMSPYAISKKMSEDLCTMYSNTYGIRIPILRYYSVYGERMDMSIRNSTAIARIIHAAISNTPFKLFGSGYHRRDHTYVGDIVNGTINAMINNSKAFCPHYELGTGRSISLKEILSDLNVIIENDDVVLEISETIAYTYLASRDFEYVTTTNVKDWLNAQLMNSDYWLQRRALYEN